MLLLVSKEVFHLQGCTLLDTVLVVSYPVILITIVIVLSGYRARL